MDLAADGQDLSGCHSDSDCAVSSIGPRCDVVTGRCQVCLPENDNCPKGSMCIDGFGARQCVSGCRDSSNCGALGGGTCCSNTCVNGATDVKNCGGCGMACAPVPNGTPGCASGKCLVAACNPGFDDCDHQADNGCETSLRSDPRSCGRCGNTCPQGLVCQQGKCL